MNFPEYRAAIKRAHEQYTDTLQTAAETLVKALMIAEQEFFEVPAGSKAYEPEGPRR